MPSLNCPTCSAAVPIARSLKERAADLRASIQRGPQPRSRTARTGKCEAKAAWRAAAISIRSVPLPLHDYPELNHPTGGAWTTRGLMRGHGGRRDHRAEFRPAAAHRERARVAPRRDHAPSCALGGAVRPGTCGMSTQWRLTRTLRSSHSGSCFSRPSPLSQSAEAVMTAFAGPSPDDA